jgi:hypothetical protein
MWQMTIPATMISPTGTVISECSIEPNAIAAAGGSLVVESLQIEPSLTYRVHWAGAPTSKQAVGSCGHSADLLVSRTDLQRLANVAGGFGVGDKGVVR